MIGIWFPITKGQFALVDRDLFEEVTKYKWTYHHSGHVERKIKVGENKFSTLGLAQFVVFKSIDEYVGDIDHENRDTRDNRRENLRVGTRGQNQANIGKVREGSSKYKGVSNKVYDGVRKTTTYIYAQCKGIHLGNFATEEEAAKAYDVAAIKNWGKFACTNFRWKVTQNGETWWSNTIEEKK